MKYHAKIVDSSTLVRTRRNLRARMTEHKSVVRRGDERNGIAVHVPSFNSKLIGNQPRCR